MVTPELHIQFAIKVGAVSITLTRSSSKRQALLIAVLLTRSPRMSKTWSRGYSD